MERIIITGVGLRGLSEAFSRMAEEMKKPIFEFIATEQPSEKYVNELEMLKKQYEILELKENNNKTQNWKKKRFYE